MLIDAIEMLDDMMAQWQLAESMIRPHQFLEVAAQCGSLEGFPSQNPENLTFVLAHTEHREYLGVSHIFRPALASLCFSVDEIIFPDRQRFKEDREDKTKVEWHSPHGFDVKINYNTENGLAVPLHIVMHNSAAKPISDKPYYFLIECVN